jgi:hypothetical protein
MKAPILTVLLSISCLLYGQQEKSDEKICYSNITELGVLNIHPKWTSFELNTVNGISVNRKNHFGIGLGIGGIIYFNGDPFRYTPVFLNYRYCFYQPQKNLSPHVNLSFGGIWLEDGNGFYSSYTFGLITGNFSLSTGWSLFGLRWKNMYFDPFTLKRNKYDPWEYLNGYVIKVGVMF